MADSSDDGLGSGCGWGCGVVIAVLLGLTVFGGCARDIARNIEGGRQEAITAAERERIEMRQKANETIVKPNE